MKEYQEKKQFKKIIYSNWILGLMFIFLVFIGYFAIKAHSRSNGAVFKNKEIETQSAKLQKRNAELEADISRLSGGAGLEEEIRKRFNVTKPGEKVLIIVDKSLKTDKIIDDKNSGGFLSKIWSGIKNIF